MFRRNNQHPAERALTGIFVRLIGCAYLIYTIFNLISAPAEDKPAPWVTALILVVLIGLSVVVIGMTIHEFITGLKTGRYRRGSYPSQFAGDAESESTDGEASPENAENLLVDDEAAPSAKEADTGTDVAEDTADEDATGETADAASADGDGASDNA